MSNIQTLLVLPLDTLAILVAGYLGYRLAYTGKDSKHSTIDTVFLSLVYALIAKAVLSLPLPVPELPKVAIAIIVALVTAALWRRWGEHWVFRLLRWAGISTSDRHVTAWDSLRMKSGFEPRTLMLRLRDGRRLMCGDLGRFLGFEAGPCLLGSDGSVALFVTDQSDAGSSDWQAREISAEEFGTEMTYVPADQIAEIKVYIPR